MAPVLSRPLLLLALAFAAASYGVLSLRAGLDPALPYAFVSPRRLVGVIAGAALFWMIVRRLEVSPPTLRGGPWRLLAMLAAAGAVLLAVRVGFGRLFADQDVPFAQDLRWLIVWIGYLGLAVGLYLAWRLRASVVTAPPLALDPAADAVDWVIDAIAAEGEPGDRRELARRLRARAGYPVADPLAAGPDARRRESIERIAAYLSR